MIWWYPPFQEPPYPSYCKLIISSEIPCPQRSSRWISASSPVPRCRLAGFFPAIGAHLVCVCVCVGLDEEVWCLYIILCICKCICACIYIYTYIHTYIYIYIFIYVCMYTVHTMICLIASYNLCNVIYRPYRTDRGHCILVFVSHDVWICCAQLPSKRTPRIKIQLVTGVVNGLTLFILLVARLQPNY